MGSKASKTSSASTKYIDDRVKEMVAKKHKDFEAADDLHPLNKILLKSATIAATFRNVRKAFRNFHRDGTDRVDFNDLVKTLAFLGSDVDPEVVRDIFHSADLYEDGALTFREFLVCLALAYTLDLIPGLSVEENEYGGRLKEAPKRRRRSKIELETGKAADYAGAGDGTEGAGAGAAEGAGGGKDSEGDGAGAGASPGIMKSESKRLAAAAPVDSPATAERRRASADSVVSQAIAIRHAFHQVLEAYCWFDRSGTGVIHKTDFMEAMEGEAAGSRSKEMRSHGESRRSSNPSAAMKSLTNERFNEIDWDHDGTITFKEFLYSFVSWVGVDEDEEDDDEGGSDDGGGGGVSDGKKDG